MRLFHPRKDNWDTHSQFASLGIRELNRCADKISVLNSLRSEIADQLVYVGLSCARYHAVIIGSLPDPCMINEVLDND